MKGTRRVTSGMLQTTNMGSRRVQRERKRATLAVVVASVLVGGALGLATGQANAANVSLSVSIRPSVAATFTDDGVTVRSNTPWQLEMSVGSDSHERVFFSGGPTGSEGASVPVGPNAEVLSVVALER